MTAPRRRFRSYGLVFDSEVAVDGVDPVPADAPADVVVRRGPVRWDPGPGSAPGDWAVPAPGVAVAEHEGVRLLVEQGRRITVDMTRPMSEASAGLALILGASCILLHQRGAMPLHAGAAAGPDGGVLLLGEPGAGKSTLSAMLAAQGMALAGDDLVALDFDGPPAVLGGLQAAKLFGDSRAAIAAAAPDAKALDMAGSGLGKTVLSLQAEGAAPWPAPLRAVLSLEWLHPPAAPPEVERLGRIEAMARLRAAIARANMAGPMGLEARYFAMAARLGAAVPVFAFRRPRRYEAADQVLGLLQGLLKAPQDFG